MSVKDPVDWYSAEAIADLLSDATHVAIARKYSVSATTVAINRRRARRQVETVGLRPDPAIVKLNVKGAE